MCISSQYFVIISLFYFLLYFVLFFFIVCFFFIIFFLCFVFFFFSSRRRHTRCGRDWSSDVCSSDLVAMVLTRLLDTSEAYRAIDWSVIVLLAAMIPVGQALESTGGAALIAGQILDVAAGQAAWVALTIILVGSMLLSNVVNNAAAAVLVAPIALGISAQLGLSPDAALMAVAVGTSCAFLTPIGHQSNALVMEPGGYRFGDYWRLGLPLSAVVTATAVPMILWVWN